MFDLWSTWYLRPPPFILRCYIVRIFVPRFTDVIFLPRINAKVLADPFHILKSNVVILAQRESNPVFREKNAFQIRVIRILHAEHVVHLALEPIRSRPDGRDAFDRLPFLDPRLHTNTLVLQMGVKDVNDFELLVLRPVDRRFINQVIARKNSVLAEECHDLHDPIFLHLDLILTKEAVGLDEFPPKPLLDRIHQRTGPGLLLRSFWFRRHGRFGTRRWRGRLWNRGLWFRWFRWYRGGFGWFRRFFSLLVILLFFCHF